MLIPSHYRETIITPKKSRNVEAIWSYVANKHGATTILPDGRCDIIIRFNLNDIDSFVPVITGPATLPYQVSFSPDDVWVGVRLRPDQGRSIWGDEIKSAQNNILRGGEAVAKFPMLEDIMGVNLDVTSIKSALTGLPILANSKTTSLQIVQAIERVHTTGGRLRISALANSVSCSSRQLNRMFQNSVGLTTKVYSSLVQFHRTLQLLKNRKLTLSEAAFEAGYADQAHMGRTVRKFSGYVPSELPSDLTTPKLFS